MNNGIFIQDIYGRVGWDGGLPRHIVGAPTVTPMPYHYPGGDWKVDLINNFVYVIDTRFSSIPAATLRTTGGGVVDWGDGFIERRTTAWSTHIYATHGVYIIQLLVPINNTEFGTGTSGTGVDPYARSIIKCLSYGNKITSLRGAFNGCLNFIEAPPVMTNRITKVFAAFAGCLNFNQDLSNYDFSGLVDDAFVFGFESLFSGSTNFNNGGSPDIGKWDTSKVTSLSSTFANSNFNQDINNWDTSNITRMPNTFQGARFFNQPLNNWSVSQVTNLASMFQSAISFNQDISSWNTSNVTSMVGMFNGALSFNQDISSWNVSNLITINGMFASANSFNQNIGNWNVSNLTNMQQTFVNNSSFNNGGSNQINTWNTSNVTNMVGTFNNASVFNQPIGSWNVSKVQSMNTMFGGAFAFNQDISSWNLAGLNVNTALDNFMSGKIGAGALSTANYDALLIGWNNNKLAAANGVANWRTDLRPNFGGAKYTSGGDAATARAALITYGWTITDGGVA